MATLAYISDTSSGAFATMEVKPSASVCTVMTAIAATTIRVQSRRRSYAP